MKTSICSLLALTALSLTATTSVFAKDLVIPDLPQSTKPTYNLSDYAGKMTFFDFEKTILLPAKQKMASTVIGSDGRPVQANEVVLRAGGGISTRLDKNNVVIDINYPNGPQGGRTYGLYVPGGQVGDWSDGMDLDNKFAFMKDASDDEIHQYIETIMNGIGRCDMSGLAKLNVPGQRSATEFVGIYDAESYRRMVPGGMKGWDTALFKTEFLSVFHSAQEKFMRIYLGQFTDTVYEDHPGVYDGRNQKPGPKADGDKQIPAAMSSYTACSVNPTSTRSGIHLEERDIDTQLALITTYEATVAKDTTIGKIEAIVGGDGKDVFDDITEFFANGKATPEKASDLAALTADLAVRVHKNAQATTKYICDTMLSNKGASDDSSTPSPKPAPKKKTS